MAYVLEDAFGDIIRKARFGQGLDAQAVAAAAGLTTRELSQAESYKLTPPEPVILALADFLGLDGPKLVDIALERYAPPAVTDEALPYELHSLTVADASGFQSNCHLLVWRESREALLVDPGAQGDRILAWVRTHNARVRYIGITHGHHDHVGALKPVMAGTGASVLLPMGDMAMIGAVPGHPPELSGGERQAFGEATLEARFTPGHTPGGLCYYVPGAVFVGDVLFAGSLGRANTDYAALLAGVGREVLTLPPDTRVMPGHGPNTLVSAEREHNPFYTPAMLAALGA